MSQGLTLSIQTVKGRSALEFSSCQLFYVRQPEPSTQTYAWLIKKPFIQDVPQMHTSKSRNQINSKQFLEQPRRNYFEHVQKISGHGTQCFTCLFHFFHALPHQHIPTHNKEKETTCSIVQNIYSSLIIMFNVHIWVSHKHKDHNVFEGVHFTATTICQNLQTVTKLFNLNNFLVLTTF